MSEKGKVYLLLGPEEGEKGQFLLNIKEQLLKEAGGNVEEARYYPFETGMAEVVSWIQNGSLFSNHKWVVIPQAEAIKRNDAAILGAYCAKPAEDTTLVLLSGGTTRDIAAAITKGIPKAQVKIFWELFENQKQNWIRSFFRERNILLTEEALELILELVENNTQEFRRECEKLALFFGEGKELSHDDVDHYLYHSKEENVFTLFDRFAAGEFSQTLEVVKKIGLSGESHPIQLLGGLLWQFKRLLSLSLQVEDHLPFEASCQKLKIIGKRMQRIYRQAQQRYTSRDMERIIALAEKTDASLREGSGDSQGLLIEMFLYYALKKKGRIPEPLRR